MSDKPYILQALDIVNGLLSNYTPLGDGGGGGGGEKISSEYFCIINYCNRHAIFFIL